MSAPEVLEGTDALASSASASGSKVVLTYQGRPVPEVLEGTDALASRASASGVSSLNVMKNVQQSAVRQFLEIRLLLNSTQVRMRGWMYILECCDGTYYTGSTNDLAVRIRQHQLGLGSNHTSKRLPVQLIYAEEYNRIDLAFEREKQVQGWRRSKKEALIDGEIELLPKLAVAYRDRRKLGIFLEE